jgi:hypothetical protein
MPGRQGEPKLRQRSLKRILAIGAVVGSLAIPSTASAAVRTYHGTLTDDPSVEVTLKAEKEDGKRHVTFFKATNLPISCDDGAINATLGSVSFKGEAKVKDGGRFTARASNGTQTIKARGKLTRSSAEGTLRYFGLTPIQGEVHGCDSGVRDWTARR